MEPLTKEQVANYADVIPYLNDDNWATFFLKDADSCYTTKSLYHYLMDLIGIDGPKYPIMSAHFGEEFVELWYDHSGEGKNFVSEPPNDILRKMDRNNLSEDMKREWLHMYLRLFRNYACRVVRDALREDLYELTQQIAELHERVKYYENRMDGKPY